MHEGNIGHTEERFIRWLQELASTCWLLQRSVAGCAMDRTHTVADRLCWHLWASPTPNRKHMQPFLHGVRQHRRKQRTRRPPV